MFARLMGLKTLTPAKLNDLLANKAVIPIDVNGRGSWAKAHVPGAMNLDPYGYTDSELPPEKTSVLVFYCSNSMCRKAPHAARRAQQMGYPNVYVMSAGIKGWLNAKLRTESSPDEAAPPPHH